MIRSLLAASLLALPSIATAQSERPLIEWEQTQWSPESQAACGVFLTKFGLLVGAKKQTNDVFQILWRGYMLNMLSEMTDPATNKLAWAAPIDLLSEDSSAFFMACGDLVNQALKDDLIPESIKDDASDEANDALHGRP